jgi:hypothetical protein
MCAIRRTSMEDFMEEDEQMKLKQKLYFKEYQTSPQGKKTPVFTTIKPSSSLPGARLKKMIDELADNYSEELWEDRHSRRGQYWMIEAARESDECEEDEDA